MRRHACRWRGPRTGRDAWMSQRSGSPYNQSAYASRAGTSRMRAAAPSGAGYALVHAGRQLRRGPSAFWVVVGALALMVAWTVATATYFTFREDVLTRLIAREAEMQFAYEDRIAELRAQIDRISSRQLLDQEQYEQKLDQIVRRQAFLEQRSTALNAPSDTTRAGAFERQVQRVGLARVQIDRLMRTLGGVPLRKPVTGEIDLSSVYGMRIDPFIRAPAMHTGLDFRGETGEPVRATANGTVTGAGWSGGYGRMVEVDHGNGLATRYGHLSIIDVRAGETIRIGQIVGRIGSTGRSTGPHLHYETRVDGEAVDPQKFLRAGARLGSVN